MRKFLYQSVLLALILQVCSLCLPVAAGRQDKAKLDGLGYPEESISSHQDLTLGFEREGTHFCIIGKGGFPREAFEEFGIRENGRIWKVRSLSDLRGRVEIANEKQALVFARLRTAPETFHLWKDGEYELEILDEDDLASLPRFLGARSRPVSRRLSSGHLLSNGFLGIFAHDHFVSEGFASPTVKEVNAGFEITRWVHTRYWKTKTPTEATRLVKEFVGKDGTYTRTVLETLTTPAKVHFPGYR